MPQWFFREEYVGIDGFDYICVPEIVWTEILLC